MICIFASAAEQIPAIPGGTSMLLPVIGALFFIGALILLPLQIRHFLEREPKRRILPSPLETRAVQDYVTVTKFEKHEETEDRKFGEVYKTIDREGKRLDGRVNDVLKAVSKIEGAFNQSQRRHHPDD